jgi:L-ascorbate metabolism protein UlaG (beta-lactamase superfamily)
MDVGSVPSENGCVKPHFGYVPDGGLLIAFHRGDTGFDLRNAGIIEHLRYPVFLNVGEYDTRSLFSVPQRGIAYHNRAVEYLEDLLSRSHIQFLCQQSGYAVRNT